MSWRADRDARRRELDPRALFTAIEQGFHAGSNRRLQRLPLHINDEAFADALVAAWHEISAPSAAAARAAR